MIRRAELNDMDAVLELARDFANSFVIDDEIFRASFLTILNDSSTHFAVAELNGKVVGYTLAFSHNTFYANGCVAWIEELVVNANCRRQGIGTLLMQSAEVWAAQRGCRLVALATRRAADFYEAMNYKASATYFRKLV